MAIPRRASADASSRSAIRLSAPKGSPALSALAAAVMSESMSHLNAAIGRYPNPSHFLLLRAVAADVVLIGSTPGDCGRAVAPGRTPRTGSSFRRPPAFQY